MHDEPMDGGEAAAVAAAGPSNRATSKKAFEAMAHVANLDREQFEDAYTQQIIDAVRQRCPTAVLRRPNDNDKDGGWATSNFYSFGDLAEDVEEVLRCIDTTRFIEVHAEGEHGVEGVLIYIGEQW